MAVVDDGVINYLWSFITPVVKKSDSNILLLIRGIKFEGRRERDIFAQVDSYCNYLRDKLHDDIHNASIMQNAGNIHGKWNIGIVNMNVTRKTLEALESFYNNGTFD